MWLVLLGFHLIGLVGNSLILRKSLLAKLDRFTLSTIAQTGIAAPAVVLLIAHPPQVARFTGQIWLMLLADMLLTVALQVTFVKALQYLEASVFSVVYNLRIALVTVLGIVFLGEKFSWLRILGGTLLLLAIVIVRQKGSGKVLHKGLLWGLAAVLSLSFLNLMEKKLIYHIGFFNYFPITSVTAGIVMWSYLLRSATKVKFSLLIQPTMQRLMVFRALSAYGLSGALATGAAISVANYVSSMNVIFLVILGALLLGERDYLKRKIIAVVVAVAGLTLVLIGSL